MNILKTLALALTVLLAVNSSAQTRFSISGTVQDSATGEVIIGAVVRIVELKAVGTVSNEYGFYSLTVQEGDYALQVSMAGYKTETRRVALHSNLRENFVMRDTSFLTNEVVITGERENQNVSDPQMGAQKLDMQEANKIPVLFGERDILKTIQLLPGVKSGGDGGSGFYVRGGSADQNLILLDEAPVYNASHLLGFFSTFNSDAIKDVTVYKGNAPAQYGGRLASVLDVKMNDGNNQRYHVSGGIGLISSKLNVEGPIVKSKGSFLVTGRRTYADVFLKLSPDSAINSNSLYFYDFNAKLNYQLNSKNRIFLSGYFGRDNIGIANTFGIGWGNATGTLRWNHIWNDRLFTNTSLIFSNYYYKISITSQSADFSINSKIRDFNLKHEFQYFPNPNHTIRFGFNSIYHQVTPGQIKASEETAINPIKLQDRSGLESAVFFTDEWFVNARLNISYGVRASAFNVLGKGDYFLFGSDGAITDTLSFAAMEIAKTYYTVEPRVAIAFLLSEENSVKVAYARNSQNLHLLSNSTSSSPTDLWIMNSLMIKPEIADQVAAGYYHNFMNNGIETSVEVYYKSMQNQIDYKNGANTQGNEKVEGDLLFGKGRAYGLELFIKKRTGRFTGWISYTLSRSERRIDGINAGSWYPVRQDRTHDISIVLMYDLSKRWSISSTWVYNTGNAVTFPSGKYYVDGQVQFLYTERNGYRMPAYHRLDIGANCQLKKTAKFESNLNISVYNVYARENAYAIIFRESETEPGKTEAVRIALFRIIPSITYNFRF